MINKHNRKRGLVCSNDLSRFTAEAVTTNLIVEVVRGAKYGCRFIAINNSGGADPATGCVGGEHGEKIDIIVGGAYIKSLRKS